MHGERELPEARVHDHLGPLGLVIRAVRLSPTGGSVAWRWRVFATGCCLAAIVTRYVAARAVLATAGHEQDDKRQDHDDSDNRKHLDPARHTCGQFVVGLSHAISSCPGWC